MKVFPALVDQTALNQIIQADFSVPAGLQAQDFLDGLMVNLGSVNSDLREGSLDVLWTWLATGQFEDAQVKLVANQMHDNLLVGLGESQTDSVFLRAFSALILGVIVQLDRERREQGKPSLVDEPQVHAWLETALLLLISEKDLRGHTRDKGWAHCAAHTGDLLGEFASHPLIGRAELERILAALQTRMLEPVESAFIHNEDERLAAVVMAVLQRELVLDAYLEEWLGRFLVYEGEIGWRKAFVQNSANNARLNSKNFLRAVYFFLVFGYKNEPAYTGTPLDQWFKKQLLLILRQIYPNNRYGDGLES